MVLERFGFSTLLIFIVCIVASDGAMVPGALGNAAIADRAAHASQDMSAGLSQTLRQAMRATPPLYSIDVSYTQKTVVPAQVHEQSSEWSKRFFQKMAKERGWQGLELRSPGFTNAANEHVVFTSGRVWMEGPTRIRTEITYFAGDNQTTAKMSEMVNMYRDGVFYLIDRTLRTVEIYDKPQFVGTSGAPLLYAGRLSGDLRVVAEIALASEPNSAAITKGGVRKSCRYVGAAEVGGISAVQIECGDADGSKKDYELLLDPNDLGRCLKIARYDRDTQRVAETREFSQFRKLKGGDSLYPYVMTHRKYGPEGDTTEVETITVSDAATGVKMSDQELALGSDESPEYQITDYRSSPAANNGSKVQH